MKKFLKDLICKLGIHFPVMTAHSDHFKCKHCNVLWMTNKNLSARYYYKEGDYR